MSRISTHVLDTAAGKPAANIKVRLFKGGIELASALTNADGRCPSLFAPQDALSTGVYELCFEIGTYFPEGFYPEVNIRFTVRDSSSNFHVPLLISPFGFTTYRGS
jgi:5-hydroxyisourate hydrolase